MQLLTLDPEGFLENWAKPEDPVDIVTANQVKRGQPIVAFLLFTGCQSDEFGNCDLEASFSVTDPGGGNYADTGFIELWKNKPAPDKGILQLGVNYLGIIIEPLDPLGEYVIFATVRDLTGETELKTIQRFSAVEGD